MSQTDTSERRESRGGAASADSGRDSGYVSTAAPYLRRGAESGAIAAVLGGAGLLGGLRALLRGDRRRGLAGLALGVAALAVAFTQRRARGSETGPAAEVKDVVGTGSDVEPLAGDVGEDDHAIGGAASTVVDTAPDVEEMGTGLDSEPDSAAASADEGEFADLDAESEDLAEPTGGETEGAGGSAGNEGVDRLGEAAIDGQSHEVPVPQRAFNQGFLAHSTEAFWGVRTRDDAVLVSQDYDAVEGRDGVRYVASSEIGDDVRELQIPDTVLDHWDEVLGGGTAVAGGDGILFATTDDLAADGVLWVLPAEWADEALGRTE